MLLSAAALMLSSVCSALVVPRETNSSEPQPSQNFIVHSRPQGSDSFDKSLGYLFAEYSYGGGYSATLHTAKSDAIAGVISDVNNPENAALNFPSGDYSQGFKLSELSEQYPTSLAQIYSGQDGTPGMAIEDGLLKWNSPDGTPISWFGK